MNDKSRPRPSPGRPAKKRAPTKKEMPAIKRPKKKAGRNTLIEEKGPLVLGYLRQAMFINQAAQAAGITSRTLHYWLEKGRKEVALLDDWECSEPSERGRKPKLSVYGEFALKAEEAEVEAEHKLVVAVTDKNPLEVLKRRFADRWGDKKRMSIEGGGEDSAPIVTDARGITPVVLNLSLAEPDSDEQDFEMEESTVKVFKGTRKDNPTGDMPKPGEYGIDNDGDWMGMTPNGHLANLSKHKVTEHDDGTISVEPSIKVRTQEETLWHGWLTRGEWKTE